MLLCTGAVCSFSLLESGAIQSCLWTTTGPHPCLPLICKVMSTEGTPEHLETFQAV